MAIIKEDIFKAKAIEQIAYEMCLAARTAPKTKGIDLIETAVVTGDDIKKLVSKMEEIFKQSGREAFGRNAESVKDASAIVVIGVKSKTAGLKPCSICGFKDCAENEAKGAICSYNSIDLGIAVSSALSKAADSRLDNRTMWTIGMAAKDLGILGQEVKQVLGIPLSATGKNIFFDRR